MAVGTEQGSLHLYYTHTNQVTATPPSSSLYFYVRCYFSSYGNEFVFLFLPRCRIPFGKTFYFFVLILSPQEVKSLVSNCDGISGCVFSDECVLWTTSYDGQVEAWDVNSGCRSGF